MEIQADAFKTLELTPTTEHTYINTVEDEVLQCSESSRTSLSVEIGEKLILYLTILTPIRGIALHTKQFSSSLKTLLGLLQLTHF